MATDTWEDGSGLWTDSADWSGGTPISTSNVVVSEGDPQITSAIAIASLSNSSAVSFINAGSSTISGAVDNLGYLNLDVAHGDGGSNLAITGVLTNTGVLQFGAADGSLSKSDTISAAGIVNTIGDIDLTGGATSADTMLFNVTGGTAGFGTAGTVSGDVGLTGNAKIVFAGGGEITTIQGLSTLSLTGADAVIADAAHPYVNSALTSLSLVAGTLELNDGASIATTVALNNIWFIDLTSMAGVVGSNLTVGGALTNNGGIDVDSSGSGGSTLVVNGALTNNDDLYIGNSGLFQSTIVTVTTLNNIYGDIAIDSGVPTAAVAALKVTTGPAGFGVSGELLGGVSLTGDSAIVFASGQIGTIESGASLELDGPTARVALVGNTSTSSALTGLNHISGTLTLESGAVLATGALVVAAVGNMDVDNNAVLGGFGGSKVTVAGTLTINGELDYGNIYLTAPDSITAQSLSVDGVLHMAGGTTAAERAVLTVTTGTAGFSGAGALNGEVQISGDAGIVFASGEITNIGGSLTLDGPNAVVADAAHAYNNTALTGLDSITGLLEMDDGSKITTTVALTNSGGLDVDTDSYGGSFLTIGGALTNLGELNLGDGAMTSAGTLSTTALHNSGTISITGGATASGLMLLDVTTGTASFGSGANLVGDVSLSGEARIEFVSGQIAAVTKGDFLTLTGANAVISDSATPASNSALQGLAGVGGTLSLNDGAVITTTASLTNVNYIFLDSSSYSKDSGGSRLTVGATLTNASTGTLLIGNSAMTAADVVSAKLLSNQGTITLTGASAADDALLDVTTGTAGTGIANTITGTFNLDGHASLMFASGQITTIGAGDTLNLASATSYVEDGATNTNSALTGLDDVEGTLQLANGAKVTTSGNLKNDQYIYVDAGIYGSSDDAGAGGSTLDIGGELINNGTLYIGNSYLTQAATVDVKTLSNFDGTIAITGGGTAAERALLDVTTGAPSFGTSTVVSGDVTLSGYSGVEFASGSIATIQSGATLDLEGSNAFVEDLISNSNSALTGLSTIAGTLDLDAGAKVTTTVAATVKGSLELDGGYSASDTGGSSFTVGGALTVDDQLSIGSGSLTAADTVTANSLVNDGTISLIGGATAAGNAVLDIKSAAPAALTGTVSLLGHSAVEFASGSLTSIANTGSLTLNGASAFVADGTAASSGALSTLATVSGTLALENGAKVTTTVAMTNNGDLDVDDSYDSGGSDLTIGGLLTNASGGYLNVGNDDLAASTLTTLNSLTNDYEVTVAGSTTANAELAVTGALINNNQFFISADAETIAGAVSGTGTFYLEAGATLTLDNSVGSGQGIDFYFGASTLSLADAKAFAAAIDDFATGDTVNASGFGTGTTHSVSGDVLTLTDGSNVAHLTFSGDTSAELGVTVGTSSTVVKFV